MANQAFGDLQGYTNTKGRQSKFYFFECSCFSTLAPMDALCLMAFVASERGATKSENMTTISRWIERDVKSAVGTPSGLCTDQEHECKNCGSMPNSLLRQLSSFRSLIVNQVSSVFVLRIFKFSGICCRKHLIHKTCKLHGSLIKVFKCLLIIVQTKC